MWHKTAFLNSQRFSGVLSRSILHKHLASQYQDTDTVGLCEKFILPKGFTPKRHHIEPSGRGRIEHVVQARVFMKPFQLPKRSLIYVARVIIAILRAHRGKTKSKDDPVIVIFEAQPLNLFAQIVLRARNNFSHKSCSIREDVNFQTRDGVASGRYPME